MKCTNCGAELQIEEEKCLYCGAPNTFAVEHRKDMKRFQKQFEKTQRDATDKARRFSSMTVRILVILGLLLGIVACAVMIEWLPYHLYDWSIKKDLSEHQTEYENTLDEMLERRDWVGFSLFMSDKDLTRGEIYVEYYKVNEAASSYRYIRDYLLSFDSNSYESAQTVATRIAQQWARLCNNESRRGYTESFYDKYFTDRSVALIHEIYEDTKLLLGTYADLSQEDLDQMADYSENKVALLIEEGLQKEVSNGGQ